MNGASSRRTVRTALFLALCLACCPLPAALASRYVTQYEQSLRDFDKSYLDHKDLYAWNVSYYMRSLAIMYEATADEKYLEILAEAIERVLAQRDDAVGDADYLGRLRPAWGTARYSTDGSSHYVWAVHTGMITYPMIRFGRWKTRSGPTTKISSSVRISSEKDTMYSARRPSTESCRATFCP